MAVQAAVLAARRAALSAARKTAERTKTASTGVKRAVVSTGSSVSWFEVLIVALITLIFNDLPDLSEVILAPKLLTGPIDVLTVLAVTFWFWLRTGEPVTKAGLKNGFKFLIEIIPFLGIFPIWTLGVLNVKLKWLDFIFDLPVSILKRVGL